MTLAYLGVVQLTPLVVRLALVDIVFILVLKAQKNSPGRFGRFSITSCSVLQQVMYVKFYN